MKICVSCHKRFDSQGWQCPACHAKPEMLDGFYSFAPSLAENNDGFNVSEFAKLAPLEAQNFWFRSRNKLIVWVLSQYFSTISSFLEIGCGTGYVLSGIERAFPGLRLSASDIYVSGLQFAKSRVERSGLFQMDARDMPFESEFDVIGAFDVLEHIADDEKVLSEMNRAVKPGGGIVLTVPQHEFLWSQADTQACHVRRYRALDLREKVKRAGFTVEFSTSFVFFLLPLMLFSRLRQLAPNSKYDQFAELTVGRFTNGILEKVLGLEHLLIRGGVRFPAGGSLLLVARKKAEV